MCFSAKKPKPVELRPPPELPEKPPEEQEVTASREKADLEDFGPGGKPQYRRPDDSVTVNGGAGLSM